MMNVIKYITEMIGRIYLYRTDKAIFENIIKVVSSHGNDEELSDDILQELKNHRVLEIAKHNLTVHIECSSFFKLLLKKVDDAILYAPYKLPYCYDDSMREVQKLLPFKEIIFIKGAAISSIYPSFLIRDQYDIDIIVPNINDIWSIIEVSKSNFTIDRLKIYIDSSLNASGSIDLFPMDKEKMPMIDVHINSFYIWGASAYKPDLWQNKKFLSNGVAIPSWEDTLLLAAAHIANQWLFRVRDINDIYLIIKKFGEALDWNYIQRVAVQENLVEILDCLFSEVVRMYVDVDIPIKSRKTSMIGNSFIKNNWGKWNAPTAFLFQTKFLFDRYKKDLGIISGAYNAVKNGFNMLVYKNRAFSAPLKRKIRKFKANEILVLVPLLRCGKNVVNVKGRNICNSESLQVINEGLPNEYFLSPHGVWVQSNYRGIVDKGTIDLIESICE